jgi:pSer/pThr/pTyr-binding forkhead associated (FHA) protein
MTGSSGFDASPTGPRPSAATQTCPACGASVVQGLPFCPSCGKRVRTALSGPACPRCGTGAPEGVRYCPACGLDLTQPAPGQRSSSTASPSPYALSLLDENGNPAGRYPLRMGETTIGREGAGLVFSDDVFMSPLHAKVTVSDESVTLRDLGSRNGTWLFITGPHRLVDGERILVGSQILEYRRLGYPGPHPPERDATRRMGSLVPSADIACLVQLRADGSDRDVFHLSPGRNLRLGREEGDVTFQYDPSMSGSHAEIRSEDADFIVADLGSRNGVALSVRGSATIEAGRRMFLGDKMLRLDQS